MNQHSIHRAIREIRGSFNRRVSVERKNKSLVKFGRAEGVGATEETVWLQGGHEDYRTGNTIDQVVSTASGDDQPVKIEGHTTGTYGLTFVVQDVTLNGLTPVPLPTPLVRATRLYNNGNTDFAGNVTVEDSTNSSSVHLFASAATDNQTMKCATSLSNRDFWIINCIMVGVQRQTSAVCDFRLQIREEGKVFRNRLPLVASSESGIAVVELDPCLIAPPNSDVRMVVSASTTNVSAIASIGGYLAR